MEIDVIPATEWDAAYVAMNARAIDKLEAKYQTGLSIDDALRDTLALSPTHAYTGRLDGEPVVMFGAAITNALEQAAAPWLVATDKLPTIQVRFLRECRPYLHRMVSDFADMRNIVYEGNIVAVRWLRWMGFEMGPSSRQGPFRATFHEFHWEYGNADTQGEGRLSVWEDGQGVQDEGSGGSSGASDQGRSEPQKEAGMT